MSFFRVTFKENVPDLRNSKSIDLMNFLNKKHNIYFYDPFVKKLEGFKNLIEFKSSKFDAVILSVPHTNIIRNLKNKFEPLLKENCIFFDIKGSLRNKKIKNYWSL